MSGVKGVKSARFELVPWDAIWYVALVLGGGADKYAERNWEGGYEWSKASGARGRHDALWQAGEDVDPGSGLPHIAHVACLALMELAFHLREIGTDDRSKGAVEKMQAVVLNQDEIENASPG